mmetsp:Transcript_31655/g.98598  ORF Transcript_31655/g.98598 Transcript_31655/m.98598 type:complete len:279 (-) Transcript_31655:1522-2358(-)
MHLFGFLLVLLEGQPGEHRGPRLDFRRAKVGLLLGQREERCHRIVSCQSCLLVGLVALWPWGADERRESPEGLRRGLREAGQRGRKVDGVSRGCPCVRVLLAERAEDLRHEDGPDGLGLLLDVRDEIATQVEAEDLVLRRGDPDAQALRALRQARQELRWGHLHDGPQHLLVVPPELLLLILVVVIVVLVVAEAGELGGCLVVLLHLLRNLAPLEGLVHQSEHPSHQLPDLLCVEDAAADILDALRNAAGSLCQRLRLLLLLKQPEGVLQARAQELPR